MFKKAMRVDGTRNAPRSQARASGVQQQAAERAHLIGEADDDAADWNEDDADGGKEGDDEAWCEDWPPRL